MGIRQNIFISIMIHTMVIASVFIVGSRSRDRACLVQSDYMVVSLLEKLSKDTPTPPSPLEKEGKGGGLNEIWKSEAGEDFKNEKVEFSGETLISLQFTKDDENRVGPPLAGDTTPHMGSDIRPASGERTDLSQEVFSESVGIMAAQGRVYHAVKGQPEDKILEGFEGIRAAIEEAKDYPFLARKKRIEGTVITGFIINSKGYPEDLRVEKGSGSEILDSAAIKIVKRAAPFPRVNGKIVVPITFKLTDSTSPH